MNSSMAKPEKIGYVHFITVYHFTIPLNGQNYQKQKGIGTNNQSLFRLENKFRKIPLLVIYYLVKFDDYYKVVFELF